MKKNGVYEYVKRVFWGFIKMEKQKRKLQCLTLLYLG
jgi:hypothetical protein